MACAPIRYKLKNWRRLHQLSQAAAAEMIGVARRTWHQWEQGVVIPGPSHMIELYSLTKGDAQPNDFYELPDLSVRKAA